MNDDTGNDDTGNDETGNDETGPNTSLQPATTGPQRVPVTDVPTGPVDPALAGMAELATADLASRLGVEASSIEIAVSEIRVWPDSSLGCPLPGMAYLQVLTDGFRIVLVHDGTAYSYHGGGNRAEPFLCEQPDTRVKDLSPGYGDT